jgi:beta-glucosidase
MMAALCAIAIQNVSAQTQYPWQDPKMPREQRVENLLGMLTPEEKVGLMMNKSISIERLGIPSYNWWSEACHGVRQGGYTVYPQPIGMAAAFNAQLVYDVFSQVSDEARANWNRSDHSVKHVGMGETYYPGNPELTFWCPNVNIFRDPRWGRGQETCGEDPYMNAVLGVQTVLGMQGNQMRVQSSELRDITSANKTKVSQPSTLNSQQYYKTHACAKHYAVHSGPEPLRHSMNVEPSNRDLWETYLPAFKALVKKGDVREVMCAYQRFEGKPCCASDRLLIDILRNKWGYDGLVVTDCDAINNFFNRGQHETHKDPLSATVDAVLNGTDLECGKVMMNLTDGLQKGLIKESDLDEHLRKTLMGRFELGMFDPADMVPWSTLSPSTISCEAHDALATQAARESMVLLENKTIKVGAEWKAVLPLSKTLRTLAVLGPNADDVELLNGNYGGTPTEEHQHSLLSGIKAALPNTNIIYEKACELNDEYQTIHHLQDFNDGKGVKVEFWNDRDAALDSSPVKTGYYNELNFSTFGAWGFAEGVSNDNLAVRISGQYKATFTGEMKYTLITDNGYVLKVNGAVVEENKGGDRRRGFGFGRRVEYKSFPVEQGKTYDVVIEYRRGNGNFAMLRGDICERKLVDFTDLANKVKQADAIIIIGGISARMEGEGGDKQDIELPKVQQMLLRAMHQTGKPVVFVNCSGSAIAFGSVEGEYDALLQAWYPGQGGAKALAEVLFGDYNPGGKLPVTFYRSTQDLPDFLDYSMKNRTYRYFTGQPQYAFGYGLSYTTFKTGQGTISGTSGVSGTPLCTITVPVTNTGKREGTETVQVYVKRLDDPGAPIKALKGFQKLSLKPGETKKAVIALDSEAFEYYDETIDELAVKPGRYQILYGTSSRDEDLQAFDFEVK